MSMHLVKPCVAYRVEYMEMLEEFRGHCGPVPFVMHFGQERFEDILQAATDNERERAIIPDMESSATWWLAAEDKRSPVKKSF